MYLPPTSAFARALIVAGSIALLAGCASGGRSDSFGTIPVTPPQASNFLQFGSNAPVLQTLDVPLKQFPTAVGTLLTGIRGNLITGFIDERNGSNLGVVYDRKTGVWTSIKYPHSAKTSVYGPAPAIASSAVTKKRAKPPLTVSSTTRRPNNMSR